MNKETKLWLEGYLDQVKAKQMSISDVISTMKKEKDVTLTEKDIKAMMKDEKKSKKGKEEDMPTINQIVGAINQQSINDKTAGETFKELLSKELEMNSDLVGLINGSKDDAEQLNTITEYMMSDLTRQLTDMGIEVNDKTELNKSLEKSFDDIIKQNATLTEGMLISATKFFGTKAGQHLMDGFRNIYGTIKGHVDEILGDIKSLLIDPVMNIGKTAYNFLTENEDEKQTSLLGGIQGTLTDIYKQATKTGKDTKAKYLEGIKDKGGDKDSMMSKFFGDSIGTVAIILFAFGAALGAAAGAILKPFAVLTKGLAFITRSMGVVTKSFAFLSKVFGPAGAFLTNLKFIGPLFKGFAQGFSKLAWPLTILLGVIDFVKGFIGSSETTFMGSLIDGIKAAVVGFIELPIKLLGWMVDGIRTWLFGPVETKTADVLMKGVDVLLNMILEPLRFIGMMFTNMGILIKGYVHLVMNAFNIIGNIFGVVWDLLTGDIEGAKDKLLNIGTLFMDSINTFVDSLTSVFSNIWNYMKDTAAGIPLVGKFFKSEETPLDTKPVPVVNANISKADKDVQQAKAIVQQKQIQAQKEVSKSINKSNESIIRNSERTNNNMVSAMTSISSNTGGITTSSIPEDIESIGLLFLNKSWGNGIMAGLITQNTGNFGFNEDTLWVEITIKTVDHLSMNPRDSANDGYIKSSPIMTYKLLAPMEIQESTSHNWEEYDNMTGRAGDLWKKLTKATGEVKGTGMAAAGGDVGTILNKNILKEAGKRVDKPMVYRDSNRREYMMMFQLAVVDDPKKDIMDIVDDFRKFSSPTTDNYSDMKFPHICEVRTTPGNIIHIKNAAITAVQPAFIGPFKNGYPSKCELTISFKDLSPLFGSSWQLGGPTVTTV